MGPPFRCCRPAPPGYCSSYNIFMTYCRPGECYDNCSSECPVTGRPVSNVTVGISTRRRGGRRPGGSRGGGTLEEVPFLQSCPRGIDPINNTSVHNKTIEEMNSIKANESNLVQFTSQSATKKSSYSQFKAKYIISMTGTIQQFKNETTQSCYNAFSSDPDFVY